MFPPIIPGHLIRLNTTMSDKNERFEDLPSGLVGDNETKKLWLPKDSYQDLGKWFTWEGVQQYIIFMKHAYAGGFTDWRLPTPDEALSLYDETLSTKDWDDNEVHISPVFVPKCSRYMWTDKKNDQGEIMRVDLYDGTSEYVSPDTKEHQAARLVRNM